MEWLNTSVTFMNSQEMLRSTPEQRGVWFTLMGYCVQQENGGRLEGVADWSDWDWQSVLKVPKKLAKEDSFLWHWEDGGTLNLVNYPHDQLASVQAKREGGRVGGLRSAMARAKLCNGSPSSIHSSLAATERKGKERKEKKGKETGGADAPGGVGTLLSSWLDHAKVAYPDWPELEATAAWAHYDAIGWRNAGGNPVRSWQSCVITCYTRWCQAGKKLASGGGAAAPGFDPEKPNAHTGGLPVFEAAGAAEVAP